MVLVKYVLKNGFFGEYNIGFFGEYNIAGEITN